MRRKHRSGSNHRGKRAGPLGGAGKLCTRLTSIGPALQNRHRPHGGRRRRQIYYRERNGSRWEKPTSCHYTYREVALLTVLGPRSGSDAVLTWRAIDCAHVLPKKDAEMHIFNTAVVALAALVATSAQAAPTPSKPYTHGNRHETPAQNLQKSRQYDHLVSTNVGFRSYRMKKECGPIKDPAVHGDCIASFATHEHR